MHVFNIMKDRLGSCHLFRNALKLNILKAPEMVDMVIIWCKWQEDQKLTEALNFKFLI